MLLLFITYINYVNVIVFFLAVGVDEPDLTFSKFEGVVGYIRQQTDPNITGSWLLARPVFLNHILL